MELKLKFISVNENDVIATSGALCNFSNEGTNHIGRSGAFNQNISFQYVSQSGGYYTFSDVNSNTNETDSYIYGIFDVNGNSTTVTVGNYYHIYMSGGHVNIKECDNLAHHGYFN